MWLLLWTGCLTAPQPAPMGTDCWSAAPIAFEPFVGATTDAGNNGPWVSLNRQNVWYSHLWGPLDHDVYRARWNGQTWEFVPVSGLNTNAIEEDPFYDEMRHTMWYSAGPSDETMNQIDESVLVNTTFTAPTVHTELGARAGDSMEPALTSDAKTIFFTTDGVTISQSTRTSLTVPFDPPTQLSCADAVESPSPTGDGRTLYFTDYSLSPTNKARIARGAVAGTAISLPELVGTFQTDDTASYFDPFISMDETLLAFTIQDVRGIHIYYVTACPR